MPELPEVETVRCGLEPLIVGKTVQAVKLNRPDLRFPFPKGLISNLKDRKIVAIGRRAKFLFFELDDGNYCIAHLGMTGRFRLEGRGAVGDAAYTHPAKIRPQHDHLILTFVDGSSLVYNDVRRFGFFDWHEGPIDHYARLQEYGPEPLAGRLDADYLWRVCKTRKAPLKSVLLNQKIIAGLGNIYVCEALFRAGLRPDRAAQTLSKAKAKKLVEAVIATIEDAIKAGGSTLRDFAQADGSAGYFQMQFAVYGREGVSCDVCGAPIKRIVQSNRSSFYCEKCQE